MPVNAPALLEALDATADRYHACALQAMGLEVRLKDDVFEEFALWFGGAWGADPGPGMQRVTKVTYRGILVRPLTYNPGKRYVNPYLETLKVIEALKATAKGRELTIDVLVTALQQLEECPI